MNTEGNSQIKRPTSYEEQIEILKSRNLLIENKQEAIEILNSINYYRLSAYMLPYKNNGRFVDGISLKDIYDLYEFDKKFRHLILEVLETIEITLQIGQQIEGRKEEEIYGSRIRICNFFLCTKNKTHTNKGDLKVP